MFAPPFPHNGGGVIFVVLEHLRTLREDRDLSQKDMAELLHIHQTTYSDYELGRLNIPLRTLCRIADFYGVSTDYLLRRTSEPRPYEN